MEISFNGRRALVTGAGKGIGREVAKSLARCGAETIALSRTQSDLDSLREEFPEMKTVCVDLNHWEDTRSALEKLGPIDLLVNNAGTNSPAPFLEVTEEQIDSIFRVNFKAAFNVAQVVARDMVSRGVKGAIVNVSSQSSIFAIDCSSVYCSTKAALDALTKVMALELGPKQIRVNAVNPTVTWTDLAIKNWSDPEKAKPMLNRIPLHRFASVTEVVDVILFLLSDKASMINGVMLPVDGGATAC